LCCVCSGVFLSLSFICRCVCVCVCLALAHSVCLAHSLTHPYTHTHSRCPCVSVSLCLGLSDSLSSSVLLGAKASKHRAGVLRRWIRVGERLRQLNCFAGLADVLSALQDQDLCALRRTWKVWFVVCVCVYLGHHVCYWAMGAGGYLCIVVYCECFSVADTLFAACSLFHRPSWVELASDTSVDMRAYVRCVVCGD
jgi:RasGEF domain